MVSIEKSGLTVVAKVFLCILGILVGLPSRVSWSLPLINWSSLWLGYSARKFSRTLMYDLKVSCQKKFFTLLHLLSVYNVR